MNEAGSVVRRGSGLEPSADKPGRAPHDVESSRMAIQFHCPACSQPIEVDDEFAQRAAQCPYCSAVVTVPLSSTIEPVGPPRARPVTHSADGEAEESPDRPPLLHVGGATDPRSAAARRYGTFALIATGITLSLLLCVVVRVFLLVASSDIRPTSAAPTNEELRRLNEQIARDGAVQALTMGLTFFTLVGAVCAIVSLVSQRRGNWRGWTSVVVCGAMAGCFCSSVILNAVGAAP